MKMQILIALGAVAARCRHGARTNCPERAFDVRFNFETIPDIGKFFRSPILRFPQLDENQLAGTRLKVLKSPSGDTLQVESGQQSLGDVLRKITAIMGVRAVVDPKLNENSFASLVFRGKDFDDLLSSMTQALGVEMVKSPSGTYFFAAKTISSQPTPQKPRDLRNGPFLFGPSENTPNPDPDFSPLNPKPFAPQPNWEKREFNGQPYYNMPLPIPSPTLPDEKFSNPYILPSPKSGPMK